MFSELLLSTILSLIVALGATKWLSGRNGLAKGIDYPREQSLHIKPVPRLGGLGILAGILVGLPCLYLLNRSLVLPIPIVLGLISLVVIALWDDFHGHVAVWQRLVVQLMAALLIVWPRPVPPCLEITSWLGCLPVWPTTTVVTLGVVWMINLYNFMDGADGLAAGMAVFGFSALGSLGSLGGQPDYAAAAFIVAASALGFLVWNLPPASIFMGDAGSTSLGFLAAAFTLWGAKLALFPPEVGLLVFAPFIVDSMTTLGRRLYRRERIWQPHRSHYYQRFILAGYSVRSVLVIYYGLMLAGGCSAILFVRLDMPWRGTLMLAWVVLYIFLLWLAEWRLSRQVTVNS